MEKQNIYILVEVTFDHFAFHENIAASTSLDEVYKAWDELPDNKKTSLELYSAGSDRQRELGKSESFHHWIQQF